MRFGDSNPLEIDEDMRNYQLTVFEHESMRLKCEDPVYDTIKRLLNVAHRVLKI